MKSSNIKTLLANKSVTMAQIHYVTTVKPAAAHKTVQIHKHTSANVQLFSKLNDATVYLNAVKKSANRISGNDESSVNSFEQSDTYYEHEDCYSIVKHRKSGKEYLYCIYNNASSDYTVNGMPASKKDIMQYLTPSDAKKLFDDSGLTYNKANDIVHNVVVRTISLENINKITACGTTIE